MLCEVCGGCVRCVVVVDVFVITCMCTYNTLVHNNSNTPTQATSVYVDVQAPRIHHPHRHPHPTTPPPRPPPRHRTNQPPRPKPPRHSTLTTPTTHPCCCCSSCCQCCGHVGCTDVLATHDAPWGAPDAAWGPSDASHVPSSHGMVGTPTPSTGG